MQLVGIWAAMQKAFHQMQEGGGRTEGRTADDTLEKRRTSNGMKQAKRNSATVYVCKRVFVKIQENKESLLFKLTANQKGQDEQQHSAGSTRQSCFGGF